MENALYFLALHIRSILNNFNMSYHQCYFMQQVIWSRPIIARLLRKLRSRQTRKPIIRSETIESWIGTTKGTNIKPYQQCVFHFYRRQKPYLLKKL